MDYGCVSLRRRFDVVRLNFLAQKILVAILKNVEVFGIPYQL